MNFVDSLNLFGVEAKQIPTIILHGAPSTATEGAVGVLGMDVDSENHDLYKCVAAIDGEYTWEPVGGGSSTAYVSKTVTLLANNWRNHGNGNIDYELGFTGMTEDAVVQTSIAPKRGMIEEAARCGVICVLQETDHLWFEAMYDVPTIDIDVEIVVFAGTNLATTDLLIGTGVVK